MMCEKKCLVLKKLGEINEITLKRQIEEIKKIG